MIFSRTTDAVLNGEKTQTRRPKKPGDIMRTPHQGKPYIYNQVQKRVRYAVGRTYAVQPGRGKKGVGRIKVTDLWFEHLHDLSNRDAEAEGIWKGESKGDPFGFLKGFVHAWTDIYEGTIFAWQHNPEVVVLEFEVIEDDRE